MAPEFKNTQIEDYFDEEAIKHKFLTPYTPQQNVVAERKNSTLIDMVRTMLDEYDFQPILDGEGQYGVSCHKPSLSSQASQDYTL
jgi:hypothetical protein